MIAALIGLGAGISTGLSARWNWWRPKAKGVPVLMYHKIGTPPTNSKLKKLWVSANIFRKQLTYLRAHRYTPILFSEIKKFEKNSTALPGKPVLITFDDGYANNYEEAFPLLKNFGMKGNIFLVYETIGKDNVWHEPETESRIKMLTKEQILEMQESGLVEFGSHTMRHRNLSRAESQDVVWEVTESKKRLTELLGREVTAFAYPYGSGAYQPKVRQAAREAGYLHDFGIKQGITPFPWDELAGPVKRLFIRGDDFMLDFHLNITRGKARF
jgi:peptidoglycan/xylan/chitin deacetylase (PgdA/CDA1 family)